MIEVEWVQVTAGVAKLSVPLDGQMTKLHTARRRQDQQNFELGTTGHCCSVSLYCLTGRKAKRACTDEERGRLSALSDGLPLVQSSKAEIPPLRLHQRRQQLPWDCHVPANHSLGCPLLLQFLSDHLPSDCQTKCAAPSMANQSILQSSPQNCTVEAYASIMFQAAINPLY